MIHMPSLKKRKEDIPLLVNHFLDKYSHETTKRVDHVTKDAMRLLKDYDWPGNVRELENAIERAVVLSKSRSLGKEDFAFLRTSPEPSLKSKSLRDIEREHTQAVLEDCAWNVTKASRILDINRVTLHRMIKRYNLKRS
jgi:two-component system response regulator HydG